MITESLPHADRNCSGTWLQELREPQMRWRCKACGAVCVETAGVFHAIVAESAMGVLLERLTREGRVILEERGPTDGWKG